MDHSGTTNDFSKQGQDLADKAANRVQGGIQDAKRTVNRAADQLSSKTDQLSSEVKPLIKRATQQTNALAQRFVDTASQASESVTEYAKENPVKAILIAAASGAVLATLIRTMSHSRD